MSPNELIANSGIGGFIPAKIRHAGYLARKWDKTLKEVAKVELYQTKKSEEMFERAKKSIAGGVASAARSVGFGFSPYPLFMERGEGSKI